MNIKFFPILKTKRAEKKALLNLNNLLKTKSITPYIEDLCKKNSNSFFEVLKDIPFIVENTEDPFNFDNYNFKKAIFSLRINDEAINFDKIENVIKGQHNLNKNVCVRIKFGYDTSLLEKTLNLLNDNDYLFVDIDNDKYISSKDYREKIKEIKPNIKIIIISNERLDKKPGRTYKQLKCDASFKDSSNNDFNTSVVNSIKSNSFYEYGFASYCTVRSIKTYYGFSRSAIGVFLIYSFLDNSFYSIRSASPDQIAKTYNQVHDFINENYGFLINTFFKNTPLSAELIKKMLFINPQKNQCAQNFIEISIVHYIEEIVNGVIC